MGDVPQAPVSVLGRTVSEEIGDRVEADWVLSAAPGHEWVEVFQLAEPADGEAAAELLDAGGPDVVGASVRWFLATALLDEADVEVGRRIEVANRRCAP